MPFFRTVGTIPRKHHTQFRRPEGELYYEELIGEEGFSSSFSLLYHAHVPSAISSSEVWDLPNQATEPNHPLKPLHFKLHSREEREALRPLAPLRFDWAGDRIIKAFLVQEGLPERRTPLARSVPRGHRRANSDTCEGARHRGASSGAARQLARGETLGNRGAPAQPRVG